MSIDNRTPRQLGEALAEAMLAKHPSRALPQQFVTSKEFRTFCKGRKFNDVEQILCEKAYNERYAELKQNG